MSHLLHHMNADWVETGVDEAGRGCCFGPVIAAAVICDPDLPIHPKLKDSKKMTANNREIVRDYVEDNLMYGIGIIDASVIDEINISNANFKAMHAAIRALPIEPEHIIVDGNIFKPYTSINGVVPHTSIIKGDDTYASIAYASVMAKTERDNLVMRLVDDDPSLDERYALSSNKGYLSSDHLDGIKRHGIHHLHRKTFGICKDYV